MYCTTCLAEHSEGQTCADYRATIEVKWKRPGAGFMTGGAFVALTNEEDDPPLCPLAHDNEEIGNECRERWTDVEVLAGETLEEARRNWLESGSVAYIYHISDCELANDRPVEAK